MAKQLKDIVKKAKEDSKLVPNKLSDMLKPGDEKKFASKHLIQKHSDRNGNDTGVFDSGDVHYDLNFKDEKRHGRKKGEDEKVYEAVEKENTKCNESAKGTMCEVHGMADCKKVKPLTEKEDKVPTPPERPKDLDKKDTKKKDDETMGGQLAKTGMRTFEEVELDEEGDDEYKADLQNTHKEPKAKKKSPSSLRGEYGSAEMRRLGKALERKTLLDLSGGLAQKRMKEEAIDEVLTKDQPAAEWIKDFVDSDNPQFEGKSKKKRTEMALAAYYSKQREKKN